MVTESRGTGGATNQRGQEPVRTEAKAGNQGVRSDCIVQKGTGESKLSRKPKGFGG